MPDVPTAAAPTTLPADWQGLDAAPADAAATTASAGLSWPDRVDLIGAAGSLDAVVATLFIGLGLAAAVFAYQLYRPLATLALAGLGVWAGWLVGREFDARMPGMILGGLLAAAAAWPSPKLSVSLCGSIVGFAVGCASWRALGLADAYAPAGGGMGLIFLAMLTFVSLRAGAILTFATLGIVLALGGVLGLAMRYEPVANFVLEKVDGSPILVPATLIAMVMACGFLQAGWSRPAGN